MRFDVNYGGCRFGSFSGACPIEPLHALENGIIPDCLTILFKNEIRAALKGELDSLVRHLTFYPPQHFASSGSGPCMPLPLEGWYYVNDQYLRKIEGWHHVHNCSSLTTGRGNKVF